MIGIYKITNPKGKIYIGQSVNIFSRWKCYHKLKNKSKFRSRIYESINKYGVDSHKFEIIEECLIEQLNEKERYWQDYYDVLGTNGLNLVLTTCDSLSGYFSDETKKRISKSKIGHVMYNNEWKNKISEGNKGKKRTDEIKLLMKKKKPLGFGEKISEKNKGKRKGIKFSEETKNKMSKSHKGTKKPWVSTSLKKKILSEEIKNKIGEGNKKPKPLISKAKKGKNITKEHKLNISKSQKDIPKHSAESKRMIGLKNSKPKPKSFIEKRSIAVLQFDLEGKFIKEWPSAKIASDNTNANKTGISLCCKHKADTSGGFIWRYKNGYN